MNKTKKLAPGSGELSAKNQPNSFVRWLCIVAMFAGIAAAASLGVRSVHSVDIGYHLMYGEEFLRTGKPVDSSPNIYTIPDDLSNTDLPPGSWIDSEGTYRFPNANWLTQVIFAGVYKMCGAVGLSILRLVLVLGILAASAITMRRLGVPAVVIGAGVMVIALVAEERFLLRPELMGYLVLSTQLCILLPDALKSRGLSWAKITLLVLLQLLLVNLHSYWMLGLGITGAVMGDQIIKVAWGKFVTKKRDENLLRRTKVLVVLFVAVVLVCFVNPWTWRIVVMPVQTLMFFKQHNIPGSFGQIGSHPWSSIVEFFPSFHDAYAGFGSYVFIFVLELGVAGILAAAVRRRWASILLIIAIGGVSLSMRRNIALGSIIIVPVALGEIVSFLNSFPASRALLKNQVLRVMFVCAVMIISVLRTLLKNQALRVIFGCVVILAAVGLFYSTISNRFYSEQLRVDRFGFGMNPVGAPMSAAEWLNDHKPKGRLWSDYTSSSNIFFFSTYADTPDGHPEGSLLTNTWAYPVQTMGEALDITKGVQPYREVFYKYGIEVVVLQNVTVTMKPWVRKSDDSGVHDRLLIPIGLQLLNDPNWTLVHIDPTYLIFIRNTGINSELARANTIEEHTFDTQAFMNRLRSMDPVVGDVLRFGGVALQRLGWYEKSIEVLRVSVDENPNASLGWFELGASYAQRGAELKNSGDWSPARENFKEAKKCFEQALKLKPGYKPAIFNLSLLQEDIQKLPE